MKLFWTILTAIGLIAPATNAQSLESLVDFTWGSGATDPSGALILSGKILYGTTSESGANGWGTVFSVNTDGSGFTILHTFTGGSVNGTAGRYPFAGLVLSGGTLYGTTTADSGVDGGTVFSINTNGTGFATLYSFPQTATNLDNLSGPVGGLVVSDDTLYGTVSSGDSSGDLVFAIGTNGTGFSVLHTFNGTDGANVTGTLALSGNTLYGTAVNGGTFGDGTIFAVRTDGTGFTNLYYFTGDSDGGLPSAGLLLSGNTLYGTATFGGGTSDGTVFSINTNGGNFTTLHIFSGPDGANPYAGLTISSNTLYGAAQNGGGDREGALFAINTDGTGFSVVYSFTDGDDGANPNSTPLLSSNILYGTTGVSDDNTEYGTVFAYSLTGINGAAGSLRVTMWPPDPAEVAQWQVDGGFLQRSGTILTNVPPGTHLVTFTPVAGWNSPHDQLVTVTNGATTSLSAYYTPVGNGAPGSLNVTVLPPDSSAAGALWQVDGGPGQLSGATVTNLTAGAHTISFTTIPGWLTPPNQPVAITSRATTSAVGVYSAIVDGPSGGLTVVLVPTDAANDGAQWQVDGGVGQLSGTTVTNLAVGTHTLSFRWISGWAAPPSQTVTISDGTATSATGRFLIAPTPGDGVVLLTNGSGTIEHAAWSMNLANGKKYTVTAVPKRGNIFSNWTGGIDVPYIILSDSPNYTFAMQSNMVLQANFASNAFVAGKGTYRGLFAPEFSQRRQNNSGSFLFNVATSGAISGSLSLGGTNVPLSGKFNQSGFASMTSKGPRGEPPITTTLQLDFAAQSVTGIVSNNLFSSALMGNQDVYGSVSPASAFEGHYTVVIAGTTNAATGPYGFSYGLVNVAAAGTVTLTGSLADGTAISQSSMVSKDGYWPLYIKLYDGKGSLWGWNYFGNRTLGSSPTLSWISGTNSAKAAVYRTGFTNEQATLIGGIYVSNFTFPSGLPITLAGGNLPAPIVITNISDSPALLTLETNKNTGMVSGSFANPSDPSQTLKFNGVIIDGQGQAAGYFLNSNASGSFTLTPQK